MAIDVLTYNALQEVNQELRQELTDLTAQVTEASSGGGGGGSTIALSDACNVLRKVAEAGYMHQANQWCLFPTTYGSDANVFCPNSGTAFTSGFKVCDTSGYYRCGNQCTWTVPSGTTCARFQIWGAGGGNSESRCCGFAPHGSTGAYASVIIPVSAGSQYTLCAGCAYCCYAYGDGYNQQRGYDSYVQGTNLSNFCAQGGWSGCMFKEIEDRADQYGVKTGQYCYCRYLGGCICRSGAWVCAEYDTPGQGYPEGMCSGALMPWVARCVCFYGSDTSGQGSGVYGHRGMWSYIAQDSYMPMFGWASTPYGFPSYCCGRGGCWICNNCGGFCQSAWNTSVRPIPGAGAWLNSSCGGNCTCGDAGRMGMVCVSYN
tara:strand:+ start:509 stop:1627 length:1119 start_codon:yes stop_codon:yes gene_type:complete